MADLFDQNLTDEQLELAAIESLARITQVTLAYLNAIAYLQSDYCQTWREHMRKQIYANQQSTKESLWFEMQNSKK